MAIGRAEERRLELLRSVGYNAVRTSHNPPSEKFLEAADRLGIVIIDEAFDQSIVGTKAKTPTITACGSRSGGSGT